MRQVIFRTGPCTTIIEAALWPHLLEALRLVCRNNGILEVQSGRIGQLDGPNLAHEMLHWTLLQRSLNKVWRVWTVARCGDREEVCLFWRWPEKSLVQAWPTAMRYCGRDEDLTGLPSPAVRMPSPTKEKTMAELYFLVKRPPITGFRAEWMNIAHPLLVEELDKAVTIFRQAQERRQILYIEGKAAEPAWHRSLLHET